MAHILLAEDDASMRQFLVTALEQAGHKITATTDGLEALEALKEKGSNYALLLTDIVMPGMDGIELSQKATDLYPSLKVMFITGFAVVALDQDNIVGEKSHILSKPFHLNDLVQKIEALLAA